MIEYPTILHWKKAPREEIVAFEKLDGNNIRAKWTRKKGFDLFGTRTQLIDENTPTYGEAVKLFNNSCAEWLGTLFESDKQFRDEREIIVFAEYFGPNSFAGQHKRDDQKKVVVIDVMTGHKDNDRRFFKPNEFIKTFEKVVEIPKTIYRGNLNDEFIAAVKNNTFNLNEGVVCKGTKNTGAHRGKMWMCKIKTEAYLQRLREAYLDLNKYGEGEG